MTAAGGTVVAALRRELERWRRILEAMTDVDLARVAFRHGDAERPVEWVVGALAPRHIDEHARSIRAALGS